MFRPIALAVFAVSSSVFAQCDPSMIFSQMNPTAGDGSEYVAISDLNGDGTLDIAVSNINSDDVSILLGNGNGTFQTEQRFGAGNAPTSVALGDLDGDGHLDVATANVFGDDVSVLLGNGDGTFQAQVRLGGGGGPFSVAIAHRMGWGWGLPCGQPGRRCLPAGLTASSRVFVLCVDGLSFESISVPRSRRIRDEVSSRLVLVHSRVDDLARGCTA